MKLIRRFLQYINPPVDPEVSLDIDRQSMRNIRFISMTALVFEILTLALFLVTRIGTIDHGAVISIISVSYGILLCALASFFSVKIQKNQKCTRNSCLAFKVFFCVAFSAWAIFVDYRHYKAGDQMLTFYAANLMIVCFVAFKPWLCALLIGGTYLIFYLSLFSIDRAANLNTLNFLVLALASVACGMILYHYHLNVCTKESSLSETNKLLESASRRDGLTGLQNRLALEADAQTMDGRPLTAYMIDINYFKEINDHYGHAAGDRMLREVSEILKKLFPDAHYYRYGGDEFLVLTHKPAEQNYGSFTYDFTEEQYGVKAVLSIGNAHGSPGSYQELFDLISRADKALYIVKERTHSAEFGGHDRRKNRRI